MHLGEVETAVDLARDDLRQADRSVGRMARLCAGRLEMAWKRGELKSYDLKALKNELRCYNPHTNTWRD